MMIKYSSAPERQIETNLGFIASFNLNEDDNIDWKTVDSFGEEWNKFDTFSENEIEEIGNDYFDIVPENIFKNAHVLDMGCGSGRWSYYIANKVKFIEAVDPSGAILTAQRMLKDFDNVRFTKASVQSLPFPNNSFDLVISLGVLHHIPNTQVAMQQCVNKVKNGGACLIYLYYNLDNRGNTYKVIFKLSNLMRNVISRLPNRIKRITCDMIAYCVYFPISRFNTLIRLIGMRSLAKNLPLSYYANKSVNILRNDSLDRFGTPLEQRFSRSQIRKMMEECGLKDITFSEKEPFWHAIGFKKSS